MDVRLAGALHDKKINRSNFKNYKDSPVVFFFRFNKNCACIFLVQNLCVPFSKFDFASVRIGEGSFSPGVLL